MDGHSVERSCTAIVNSWFGSFDAVRCLAQNYQRWRGESGSPQIRAVIRTVLEAGGTDAQAMLAILLYWDGKGREASRLGTAFHKYCEMDLNGEVHVRV